MARQDLGKLISVATTDPEPKPSEPTREPEPSPPADATGTVSIQRKASEHRGSSTATDVHKAARTQSTTAPETPKSRRNSRRTSTEPDESPRYQDFERLDTRLRGDQVIKLELLARKLTKQREPADPRVTKNTLIRVAVDMLLEAKPDGGTETRIRASVGLK